MNLKSPVNSTISGWLLIAVCDLSHPYSWRVVLNSPTFRGYYQENNCCLINDIQDLISSKSVAINGTRS